MYGLSLYWSWLLNQSEYPESKVLVALRYILALLLYHKRVVRTGKVEFNGNGHTPHNQTPLMQVHEMKEMNRSYSGSRSHSPPDNISNTNTTNTDVPEVSLSHHSHNGSCCCRMDHSSTSDGSHRYLQVQQMPPRNLPRYGYPADDSFTNQYQVHPPSLNLPIDTTDHHIPGNSVQAPTSVTPVKTEPFIPSTANTPKFADSSFNPIPKNIRPGTLHIHKPKRNSHNQPNPGTSTASFLPSPSSQDHHSLISSSTYYSMRYFSGYSSLSDNESRVSCTMCKSRKYPLHCFHNFVSEEQSDGIPVGNYTEFPLQMDNQSQQEQFDFHSVYSHSSRSRCPIHGDGANGSHRYFHTRQMHPHNFPRYGYPAVDSFTNQYPDQTNIQYQEENSPNHEKACRNPLLYTTTASTAIGNNTSEQSSHPVQSDHHWKDKEHYYPEHEVDIACTGKNYHLPDTFSTVVQFTVFPSGSVYHSVDHGVTIIVPEGAVSSPTKMWFSAALYGPFAYPSGHVPVSAIVWLQSDVPLFKPAVLRMPYYLTVKNEEECQKLTFLTGDDVIEDNSLPLISLRPDSRQGTFTPGSSYASIEMDHFCFECITCIDESLLDHCRYCITEVIQATQTPSQWKVEYCVTYTLPTCLKVRLININACTQAGTFLLPPSIENNSIL